MQKSEKNLAMLYMLFGVALVTANAIATKIFTTGVNLMGAPVTLTVGAICYPITFLVTDVISELWGKKEAQNAVKFGFIAQIVSTLIIIIARYLPAVDADVQNCYVTLLGQNWVFVVASLTAFLLSQSWDVHIFHKIRDSYIKKHGTHNGGRWIWNNASTMSSQLIDSVVYVLIAFGLGFKWLFDSSMWKTMIAMIIGQYIVKFILAALDTPLFYLLTTNSNCRRNRNESTNNKVTEHGN